MSEGAPFIFKSGVYVLKPFSSEFHYMPEATEAWRGATKCFIRFGDLPENGRSWNNMLRQYEFGVSVFVGRRIGNKVMAVMPNLRGGAFVDFFHMWYDNLPVYTVRGKVYKYQGGVGEPLLNSAHIVEKVQYASIS